MLLLHTLPSGYPYPLCGVRRPEGEAHASPSCAEAQPTATRRDRQSLRGELGEGSSMSHAERHAHAFTREETYAATRRPVSLAETLLPEAYTSGAFFALERERVFGSTWVAVGCAAQLREPGDVLVTDVAGRSIFVVRKEDGALQAFYKLCRHPR